MRTSTNGGGLRHDVLWSSQNNGITTIVLHAKDRWRASNIPVQSFTVGMLRYVTRGVHFCCSRRRNSILNLYSLHITQPFKIFLLYFCVCFVMNYLSAGQIIGIRSRQGYQILQPPTVSFSLVFLQSFAQFA